MKNPEPIDRISATTRPDAPVVMFQKWHHLLFLHWDVPPAELQALLPAGLDLDLFDGKAYVGLVPFTVTGARPALTPPMPFISSFHEVNVRTYVHRNGKDPGVWFFSLDASSAIAVTAAHALYKLPYFASEITFESAGQALPQVTFDARRVDPRGALPANAHIRYQPADGVIAHASPGTVEHFLIERYILYASEDDGTLYRARVHHAPYPIQRAEVPSLDETLVWAAGVKRSEAAPLRHYVREVDVEVFALERCDADVNP